MRSPPAAAPGGCGGGGDRERGGLWPHITLLLLLTIPMADGEAPVAMGCRAGRLRKREARREWETEEADPGPPRSM